MSLHPPLENQPCRGRDLRHDGIRELSGKPGIRLEWLIDAYKSLNSGDKFFIGYFDTLAGSGRLRAQIQEGKSAGEIRNSWMEGLHRFQVIRSKYLLYPDSDLCRGM